MLSVLILTNLFWFMESQWQSSDNTWTGRGYKKVLHSPCLPSLNQNLQFMWRCFVLYCVADDSLRTRSNVERWAVRLVTKINFLRSVTAFNDTDCSQITFILHSMCLPKHMILKHLKRYKENSICPSREVEFMTPLSYSN